MGLENASRWPADAPTVEEVRDGFSSAGFQVDQTVNWDWTSPPVSTLQVHDPARGRVVMVLVYGPDDPGGAGSAISAAK
jgi:hypothetical protein